MYPSSGLNIFPISTTWRFIMPSITMRFNMDHSRDMPRVHPQPFAGCFYHGYEHCFNACHLNPVTKKTYGEIRKQFQLKVSALKINHVLNGRCWVAQFLSTLKLQSRINPCDSLYGGRTKAIEMYHKAEPGEKIRYHDFTSLYPTVQARCPYPVRNPEIILRNFKSVEWSILVLSNVPCCPPEVYIPPCSPLQM
jgi:hypothetical protein